MLELHTLKISSHLNLHFALDIPGRVFLKCGPSKAETDGEIAWLREWLGSVNKSFSKGKLWFSSSLVWKITKWIQLSFYFLSNFPYTFSHNFFPSFPQTPNRWTSFLWELILASHFRYAKAQLLSDLYTIHVRQWISSFNSSQTSLPGCFFGNCSYYPCLYHQNYQFPSLLYVHFYGVFG